MGNSAPRPIDLLLLEVIDIGNCWLEELQRVHREMDWSQLPTIKPIPSVFLKFEEVSTTDVEH